MTSEVVPASKNETAQVTESVLSSVAFGVDELKQLDESAALGAAFGRIREEAFERCKQLTMPHPKDELWRQTRADLFPFKKLIGAKDAAQIEFALNEYESAQPVSAIEGCSLQVGLADAQKELTDIFSNWASNLAADAVSALQLCSVRSACVLRVKKNVSVEKTLSLSQLLKAGSEQSAAGALIVVILEKGAKCKIVEDLSIGSSVFYAPRVEFVLQDGSSLDFTSIQDMSAQSIYLGRQRFHVGRDVSLRAFHAFLGAAVSRLDLDCRFYQPGSTAELNSIYFASASQHLDFHPLQEHIAPYCRSDLTCRGALRGQSRGVYYGLIKVAEGADKTDAFQKNRNLLLSEDARIDSVPNLEIRANDVKCSHGATVGQLGADEMFYLMTRGLNQEQAEKLLVEGFFEDLLSKVEQPKLRERIRGRVLEKLHA